jgi:hypothetical protein
MPAPNSILAPDEENQLFNAENAPGAGILSGHDVEGDVDSDVSVSISSPGRIFNDFDRMNLLMVASFTRPWAVCVSVLPQPRLVSVRRRHSQQQVATCTVSLVFAD